MKLSVVIPVYNEANTIGEILRRVKSVRLEKEIIVVDDGSTDGTREFLSEYGDQKTECIKVLYHNKNRGKGAALRTGFGAVTGDVVTVQDADLEYDPREYPRLLKPILDGRADVVYGSRFLGFPRRVLFFWHTVGNRILTLVSNMMTNLNLTDMETGYKVFRAEVLRRIRLKSNRFGFEPEITAKIAKMGCRVYEVPISYSGRDYWEGKKIGWKDGISALWSIFRFNLFPGQIFRDRELETLHRMKTAQKYNQWVFDRLQPFIGDRVLEVGAGIGNMSRFLVNRKSVILTDIHEDRLNYLRERYRNLPCVSVQYLDISDGVFQSFSNRNVDTVICLNVLEHIGDDRTSLNNMYRILSPGGRLILLVPAFKKLFGEQDKNLEHRRRYEEKGLKKDLQSVGFQIVHSTYLNALGAIGWFVNGRILRKKNISPIQLRIFSLFAPLWKLEERCHIPLGISLLVVGKKPGRKQRISSKEIRTNPKFSGQNGLFA